MKTLEVGDVILCTVEKITKTTVFVSIDGFGEGSITMSEIAPGRIRNLRDYVVLNKRIICKVLRAKGNHYDLSLRRVTPKEQKEIREHAKVEKSCKSVLKTILGKKADGLINTVLEKETVYEFCERIKEDPKDLGKVASAQEIKKIQDILNTQKKKTLILKKTFSLMSSEADGVNRIKAVLSPIKKAKIRYISAGKYTISMEGTEPKKIDTAIKDILEGVENAAKEQKLMYQKG